MQPDRDKDLKRLKEFRVLHAKKIYAKLEEKTQDRVARLGRFSPKFVIDNWSEISK